MSSALRLMHNFCFFVDVTCTFFLHKNDKHSVWAMVEQLQHAMQLNYENWNYMPSYRLFHIASEGFAVFSSIGQSFKSQIEHTKFCRLAWQWSNCRKCRNCTQRWLFIKMWNVKSVLHIALWVTYWSLTCSSLSWKPVMGKGQACADDFHSNTHTHTPMHVRTYMRTYIHTYIHTYIYTYIYTYEYTYIHMYTHTHTHTLIHT